MSRLIHLSTQPIAILSDIHANVAALKEVLNNIKKNKIKTLIIAGDFVGYYYRSKEVFSLLQNWNWIGIKGNHDVILERIIVDKNDQLLQRYTAKYGNSLTRAVNLPQKYLYKLFSLETHLEIIINNKRLLVCHGSPWAIDQYVYPDSKQEIFDKFKSLKYDYILCGHTHYPLVKQVSNVFILNPGSVGQPRDFGSLASWLFADFKTNEFVHHRVKFDTRQVIEEVKKLDPQLPYLTEVFLRKQYN